MQLKTSKTKKKRKNSKGKSGWKASRVKVVNMARMRAVTTPQNMKVTRAAASITKMSKKIRLQAKTLMNHRSGEKRTKKIKMSLRGKESNYDT